MQELETLKRNWRRGRWWRWPLQAGGVVFWSLFCYSLVFPSARVTTTLAVQQTPVVDVAQSSEARPIPITPRFSLAIKPSSDQRSNDSLSGEHGLSTIVLERRAGDTGWPLKTQSMTVGCVPCYGPMTYVVVIDGKAYPGSGLTMPRAYRMSVKSEGKLMPLAEDYVSSTFAPGKHRGDVYDYVVNATERVPGCATAEYIMNFTRIGIAASGGRCLSDHKP